MAKLIRIAVGTAVGLLSLLSDMQGAATASPPHFTVLSGTGTVVRSGKLYSLSKDSWLLEGDQIRTPQLTFCVDFCAGVATARGYFSVVLLRREGSAIRELIAFTDYLSFVARPFSNPRSLIQFQDLVTGASITYPPNRRLAALFPMWEQPAIRLQLASIAKQTIAVVDKGEAEIQNQGQTLTVPSGYGNRTRLALPPESPIPAHDLLALTELKQHRSPTGLHLSAKINPLSRILVQGMANGKVSANDGLTEIKIPYPRVPNQLKITVVDPFGQQRNYFVPWRERR